MQTLTFQNTTLIPAKVDNQIWLTSGELAKALDYADTQSVTKIYERNADEFNSSMTAIATVKTNGGMQKMRIFSLRGCHLIAMFARTKIAKEFRKWVLDILDKEVGEPVQVAKITDSQAYQIQKAIKQKCLNNKVHYQTIYHALYDEFGVKRYKDILAVEFDKALAFIESFVFTPNLALVHNILADQAHQNKKAKGELNEIIGVVRHLLDHIGELQHRLDVGERNIKALQTRFII
ncbi:BRO family protein [Moraxella bovis]|uniref:ORF6C domain-containing protein n=1 Tax=Moraxella bovis TaxID=476 RepID=A0AAX3EQU7_MORBO|nr:BRO family protein [Moraxella bovis]UYZ74520.1 ORF6C domain-containing protein [Moraxella bovis]UYZ79554.1 ORF6C domain-containing protein [Moraxella bovis]UYZ79847.1 ORF6C domain-containing protein [Moraxella bovis]UYZ88036.1 ORF6C domain-containing protein [Moraxella bovis]UYZ90763.1 ORF6C domain-containing protein [Moraxella bovis]